MEEEEVVITESLSDKNIHETNTQHLKIYYLNVNSLTIDKIRNPDMISDLNNADIICLTETHLRNEEEFPIIPGYNAYHSIVNRNTRYIGRNIKGISIYYKENLGNTKLEEIANERGNLLIIKITNLEWRKLTNSSL